MKRYKSIFKEENDEDVKYIVLMLGGSVGAKHSVRSVRELKGDKVPNDIEQFSSKDDAKIKQKRMNSILSPGDKKYYGISYAIAEVINGIYTGK